MEKISSRSADGSSFALLKYQANLTAQISKTEAWKESFTTPDGKISIQIRSLLAADDKGRYHLIMWRDDTRVYEEYLPEVTYGYWFRAVRDEENDKTFFVVASRERAKLYGFDGQSKKMNVYVDSRNFHSGVPRGEANITPLTDGSAERWCCPLRISTTSSRSPIAMGWIGMRRRTGLPTPISGPGIVR